MLEDKIKKAVQKTFDAVGIEKSEKKQLDEAYFTSPKPFNQSTEFLSQKLKDAHEKLYHANIDTLNEISAKLDSAGESGANSSEYRSLKIDEIHNLNSVYLHELFFANSFHPESRLYLDDLAYMKLSKEWGEFDRWQEDIIKCAQAARDGWAVTGYSCFLQRYVNTIVDQHSMNVMVGIYPLIVLDLHEHAYSQSFLNNKEDYITVLLKELDWEIINERFTKIESITKLLK
jgi:Fe-Mn family superoxide dismutase